MQFRVSYSITGTFDIEVPDEEIMGLVTAINYAKEMLKDSAFQAAVIQEGKGKKVTIIDTKPLGDNDA